MKNFEDVRQRIAELQAEAIDVAKLTPEVVLSGLFKEATTAESASARVAAWKLLGNFAGLFVIDENSKPKTAPEIARAIAGDDDELYRMILTRVPLAPSEKV